MEGTFSRSYSDTVKLQVPEQGLFKPYHYTLHQLRPTQEVVSEVSREVGGQL